MKLALSLLTLTLLSTAPFQCASDPEPEHRIEDTPSEALWNLSEHFRSEGNDTARRQTLEHLIERYPHSREAERARLVLSGREVSPDPVSADDDSPGDESAESPAADPEDGESES